MKEAIILNYLSVLNKPPADNICGFLDLIETNTDLYLIQEYGGDHTLQEFIQTAHGYIQQNKLRLKNWRITVKFIFWQIAVMMYWLHNDMNTCHLDLNVDNISIKNGNFLLHKKDGSITVDSKGLTVKLSDFGFAEIFLLRMMKKITIAYSNVPNKVLPKTITTNHRSNLIDKPLIRVNLIVIRWELFCMKCFLEGNRIILRAMPTMVMLHYRQRNYGTI
eukprot:TRINITY_DN9338_c0_g1_i1.p1 TRINITY_DN9338_c0_g1~~TRINITY_DN9338_c0_g1_i1.p1  ORF type:complete len:220 (+),score=41.71 TRINITY_DN9338_c0_g1_i1:31-690(+)